MPSPVLLLRSVDSESAGIEGRVDEEREPNPQSNARYHVRGTRKSACVLDELKTAVVSVLRHQANLGMTVSLTIRS
jgi:hypothetical protein